MVFEPRFRRVAALNRSFVNRESALEAVAEELRRIGRGPRVLNVTGVGGIGKSRLLREIRDRVSREDHRTADLDLQVPVHRQQADALAVLRLQLGEQGVRFDRYTQLLTEGRLSGEEEAHLISKLTDKLNAAGAVWGWRAPIERDAVESAVRQS